MLLGVQLFSALLRCAPEDMKKAAHRFRLTAQEELSCAALAAVTEVAIANALEVSARDLRESFDIARGFRVSDDDGVWSLAFAIFPASKGRPWPV